MIQKLGAEQSHLSQNRPEPAQGESTDNLKISRGGTSWVELFDGTRIDLQCLTLEELDQLHWEQETRFAEQIKSTVKGSKARSETIRQAYQTVCQILDTIGQREGESELVMGMDQRYTRFVIDRIRQLEDQSIRGGLFEIGFGTGQLLKSIAANGTRVGGLEVAPQLGEQAKRNLPAEQHGNLCLGNFTDNPDVDSLAGSFSLVYWNDVFEHVPTDEISDYLSKAYDLLVPGGQLVTITPNWHMRPMDVTAEQKPPRTTAMGFHLKEYTLSEVCELLTQAGFRAVETPMWIGKRKIWSSRWLNWTGLKRMLESGLEWLPYRVAVQACRRLGFTMTIATKPK